VSERPTLDVSRVPTVAFGARTTLWLGFVGVIIIEGVMILLVIVAYFYLAALSADWPPGGRPPPLPAGVANTVVFLLSIVPAARLKRAAAKAELGRARALLVVLSVIAVATIALSGWGFASLDTRRDANAYGSLVWMLLGMHALALIAAALVIWVLAVYMFLGLVEGHRYMNVYESADFWLLAAFLWLPTWFVIYVAPRLV
jgi:heme/copper-type cytochrome/quinol oxidase subunit 3